MTLHNIIDSICAIQRVQEARKNLKNFDDSVSFFFLGKSTFKINREKHDFLMQQRTSLEKSTFPWRKYSNIFQMV